MLIPKRQRWVSTTFGEHPPSVNQLPLNPRDPKYRKARDNWIQDFAYSFNEAGNKLPKNIIWLRAYAVLTFTKYRRRDSGNYKALIEKWLGDALQHAGIIKDDTHDIYSFGNVAIFIGPAPGFYLVIDYLTDE